MLFKKDAKIAFVLPPKCGSISVKSFLMPLGFKVLTHSTWPPHHHAKYRDALAAYPNLADYTKYGVFRDPLPRFISAVNYIRGEGSKFTYEYFIENLKGVSLTRGLFFTPQVEWLDHADINIINFDNLIEGVIAAVQAVEGDKTFPHLHKSPSVDEPVTDAVKEFVRNHYAADYQFAKDVLGKEY